MNAVQGEGCVDQVDEAQAGKTSGGWARVAFGALCGGVFLYLFVSSVDLAAAMAIIARLVWWPILLGLAAFVLEFVLRAVRFAMLLETPDRKVAAGPTIAPFIASFGISDILPLRLGDVFRVVWFNRAFKLPVSRLLAAMVLERVFDLLSILLLAAVAIGIVGAALQGPVLATLQIVLAASTAIGLLVLLAPRLLIFASARVARLKGEIWAKAAHFLGDTAAAIGSFRSVPRLLAYFAFSLLIWLLESVVILGAWIALGGSGAQLAEPFFAFTISTLGTLVPALPGHFGTYEYFGVLAFEAVGVERTFAAAVILVSHLVLWLPTALFAILWLLSNGQLGQLRLGPRA